MSTAASGSDLEREALKRAAAEAAVDLVQDGMVVGLGTGSTAALAVDALARRYRQGLRFLGIPTSERIAAQATIAGIPLTSFAEHRQIDLTIDGADEVERGTLNLIKGLGGALLREKIVAAASRRLVIIVDETKLVDRLGTHARVPVEIVAFGLEATSVALEALGASARLRRSPAGEPFITDNGNRILDCNFGAIAAPARLEERIGRIVGVVENGLFISRADAVFVAEAAGVHRLDSPRAHRDSPPILVIVGVSEAHASAVARELVARLGWSFEEGDALHPEANVVKMHAGIPLTDADRQPWLERVAAWIDGQRSKKQPGVITCSALKRSHRRVVIGDRPDVRLVYLRGGRDLIAEYSAGRANLPQSEVDALEEPQPDEDPLTIDVGPPAGQVAEKVTRLLGSTAKSRRHIEPSLPAERTRATMRQDRADTALSSSITDLAPTRLPAKNVLVIDVGGNSVKLLATGQTERRSFCSGPTLTPKRMVARVKQLTADWTYDVVSIGYPGPVLRGRPTAEPHNLGRGWVGFDFAEAFGRPVKVINDAAMQALGSYKGGKMLFLGLGTGLGSAMIVEGIVEPMELGHLPYKKGTYEDYIGRIGLERDGKKKWRRHVFNIVERLIAALQPDDTVIGGGNIAKLKSLPPHSRPGENFKAFRGGFLLWAIHDVTPPDLIPGSASYERKTSGMGKNAAG
jgi:ribose 5-phosphate isomerase